MEMDRRSRTSRRKLGAERALVGAADAVRASSTDAGHRDFSLGAHGQCIVGVGFSRLSSVEILHDPDTSMGGSHG